ncbi:MAG: hypothetical protein M3460_04485 [Actinomycetota bacterium]|nr:hypothetical protein [Actinomycetota bacterium]
MPAYAVRCYTCLREVWQGDVLVEPDGLVLLNAYAEFTAGKACPSGNETCPHKTTNRDAARKARPATVGEVELLQARLAALEGRNRP